MVSDTGRNGATKRNAASSTLARLQSRDTVVTPRRRCLTPAFGTPLACEEERSGLERRVEDAEPAGQVLLDRQLLLQLRLQLELLRVVSLLVVAGRDERPECAALVPVDPVHGMLAAVELEDG